jgi:hypothetical protein
MQDQAGSYATKTATLERRRAAWTARGHGAIVDAD